MAKTAMSLTDYWDLLDNADWFYEFADNREEYWAGKRVWTQIMDAKSASPEHLALFKGFWNHKYNGPTWKTKAQPKPERPS